MSLEIASLFRLPSEPVECVPYGSGHINRTFLVTDRSGNHAILQQINHHVFRDVPSLMHNVAAVTAYLAERVEDPRRMMRLIPDADGNDYRFVDGGYWRMLTFVENSICLQSAETPEDFAMSGRAFGAFQRSLAEFPAETLRETIPRFHDTPKRVNDFKAALAADSEGRAAGVRQLVDFVLSREENAQRLMRLQREGAIPVRVTHNDTKLNNVLLDADTRQPLCVIDLDTVMPGLTANDFGDSIRFGASTAAEDEPDLSRVHFSMPLYRAYTQGFLEGCGGSLTPAELETLPVGAWMMTYECGTRFLTDYLEGDHYFHVSRPGQNLDRCRTQFRLVEEMEACADEMLKTVLEISGAVHA